MDDQRIQEIGITEVIPDTFATANYSDHPVTVFLGGNLLPVKLVVKI